MSQKSEVVCHSRDNVKDTVLAAEAISRIEVGQRGRLCFPLDYALIVCEAEAKATTQSLRGCGRGSGAVGRSVVVSLKGFVEDSERFIEQVCRTM